MSLVLLGENTRSLRLATLSACAVGLVLGAVPGYGESPVKEGSRGGVAAGLHRPSGGL